MADNGDWVLSATLGAAGGLAGGGACFVELVALDAAQRPRAAARSAAARPVGGVWRFGEQRVALGAARGAAGLRVRVGERRLLRAKWLGERTARVNVELLRGARGAARLVLPLGPRAGHPRDKAQGSVELWLAVERAASPKPLEAPGDDAAALDGGGGAGNDDNAGDDDDDDDFGKLIFGERGSVMPAPDANGTGDGAGATGDAAADDDSAAPLSSADFDLYQSAMFQDNSVEDALCGASFVLVPSEPDESDCTSIRDGPAAVLLQALRQTRAKLSGDALELSGDSAACSNVIMYGGAWYAEATVTAAGRSGAQSRFGVCAAASERAVFCDGTWCQGDVLALLVDVDAGVAYFWRHARGAGRRLALGDVRVLALDGSATSPTPQDIRRRKQALDRGEVAGDGDGTAAAADEAVRFYAAVGGGWRLRINFGAAPFACQRPRAARTLHMPLKDAQLGELHSLFDRLSGSAADDATLAGDGVATLFAELEQATRAELTAADAAAGLDADALPLVLAWRCQARQLWQFTRDEFVLGSAALGAHSMPTLATALVADARVLLAPFVGAASDAADDFAALWDWAFDYLRDESKVLLTEEALLSWQMLLAPKRWPLYQRFVAFVRAQYADGAVSRDAWHMLLPFAAAFADEKALAAHDPATSTFNVLHDEFADHVLGREQEFGF